MFGERMSGAMDKDQLVDWLEKVLQPVEPSRRFLRRLQARLVSYQGGRVPTSWLVVLIGGTALVIVAIALGLGLRLLLGLLNLVKLDRTKPRGRKKDIQPTTS